MTHSETVNHLLNNVLPAAEDYLLAERELTAAYKADATPSAWETAARKAKRRAAELAIAIDGLTDRCSTELCMTKTVIRKNVSTMCLLPGSGTLRPDSHERIRAVANAYKHQILSDPSLPIASQDDVLAVGLGYGLDGFGVGKCGGVEVLVREHGGTMYKFLADSPTSIAAWFKFLVAHGVALPAGPYEACGLQVHP
jgi:hypothetical protein